MSSPFFSIAVPCCDVAKYVRECFDSVVSQSFRDWEIVAYVETSGDDTEAIVREYAAREPRIRVFAGPRSGSPSVAHNICTDEGLGQYMICLDGDDKIAEGSLQRLHDKIAARPGSDIYPCAIKQIDELAGSKETIRDNYPSDFSDELDGVDATIMTYRGGRSRCPMRQLSIYSLAYLRNAALKCVPGLQYEDSEFTLRALYQARCVIPLHEAFYIYRKRAGSITTDAKAYVSSLYSFAAVFRSHFEFSAKVSAECSFKPELSRLWAKAWLEKILFKWFNPRCVKHVPRFERVKTLRMMFENGFANASKLMHNGRAVDKIAFALIRAFLAFPFARPSVEKFFALFYFRRMGIGA